VPHPPFIGEPSDNIKESLLQLFTKFITFWVREKKRKKSFKLGFVKFKILLKEF
jgi:hypothetical protein